MAKAHSETQEKDLQERSCSTFHLVLRQTSGTATQGRGGQGRGGHRLPANVLSPSCLSAADNGASRRCISAIASRASASVMTSGGAMRMTFLESGPSRWMPSLDP